MKLKQAYKKDIPDIKYKLILKQKGCCKICGDKLLRMDARDRCIDHEHFGDKRIRAVLCRRCNACEGKLWNSYIRTTKKERRSEEDYIRMLKGLAKYPKHKATKYIHPKALKVKRRKKK